ncbi:MAG: YigZ family protein [Nanoarchaeota archaeon]|jgi:putative IMPACT (imprinted ancient) family translation regulator|nr:YigZ family protein [Nanoarchaeota archaeon]
MKLLGESKIVVRKSKFFGYLYEIESKDEIERIVEDVLFENKKAKHVSYGAFIESEEISKNDGEVGSPGKVLLQLLRTNELNNHVLIVARIFGGVKLGVGGVSRAFRECGNAAISNC